MLSDVIKEFSCRNKDLRVQKVYSVTNSDGFVPSQDYFSKDVFSKDLSNYKIVRKGMLAYNPSRINVGSVACLQSEDEVIVSPLYVVVEVNEKKLLAEYLNLFLHSDIALEQIKSLTSGSVRDSLKYNDFTRLCFPLPSVETQQAVIEKLSAVKNLIAKREQQLAMLDQLAKSRFIEMFGNPFENPREWSIISIGTIIQHANNGMARRGNDEAGNIVLRLVELQAGFLDYTNPNRIILTKQESERFLLKENDFLFARVNGNPENVGRCTYFKELSEPVYHNDHIIRVQFKEQTISSEYLQHLLNSPYGRSEMRNKIKTSAGQYTINQEGIGGICIPLPPLELQNKFAAFVEQLDKSKVIGEKQRFILEKITCIYIL